MGHVSLEEQYVLKYFKMVPLSYSCWKHEGILPQHHCENLVELPEVKLTKAWGPPSSWIPLECLALRLVHCYLPVIINDSPGFLPQMFLLMGFCSSSWHSLLTAFLPFFNLGSSGLLCDLTSHMDLRRVVDFFSVCLDFHLVLGQSGVFWAPFIPDWKLKVSEIYFGKCL